MRRALGFAVIASTAVCAVVVASALAAPSGTDGTKTLALVEKTTSFTASVNSPPKALSQGDAIVRGSDWMKGSKVVGRGIAQCWVGSKPGAKGAFLCQSSISLPQGQIDLAGTVTDSEVGKKSVVAIVGGTGAYRGARGQAVESVIDDESSRWTLTFETS